MWLSVVMGRPPTGPASSEYDPACWSWKQPTEADLKRLRRRWLKVTPELEEIMTEADWRWALMGEWHDDRCAICGRRKRNLVTDHDHKTGLVRGYLCRSCNTAEGCGSTDIVEKYRQRHPAMICGVQEPYVDLWWGAAKPVSGPCPGTGQ